VQESYAQSTTQIDSLNKLISQEKSNTQKIKLLNELATTQIDAGEYTSALSVANRALQEQEALNLDGVDKATSYLRIAEAHSRMSEFTQALANYELAIPILQKYDDIKGLGGAYEGIGIINYYKGKYDLSMEAYSKSLVLREEVGDQKKIASSLNNVGMVHSKLGKYSLAKKYYKKSLKIKEDNKLIRGVSYSCNNLGDICLAQKEYDEALFYYERALKIREDIKDSVLIAYTLSSIGSLYTAMNNLKWGQEYFLKSIEIKEKTNNRQGIAKTLVEIGKLDIKRRKYSTARKNLLKALKIAQKIEILPVVQDCYHQLYIISEKENNPRKALDYFKKYAILKDSLQNAKHVNEIETRYQVSKKQEEVDKQKMLNEKQVEEAQKQSTRLKFLMGGVFALLLLAAFFIWNIKQKKNANAKLSKQKAEVEQQREEINAQHEEIYQQNMALTEHENEITGSIQYAQNIQKAILPSDELISSMLNEHFILYLPKDIVSGDFYWLKQIKNFTIVVVADCTGHGVPGAFMSMLGSSFLSEIITRRSLDSAGQNLDRLRSKIKKALKQTGEEGSSRDGMDLSLFIIDNESLELQFSGAYNSLIIIRNEELIQLKADRQPVAIYSIEKPFSTQKLQLQKGDCIYAFSDGFADQFGGELGKKYKTSNFKKLLKKISHKPMTEQNLLLNQVFHDWRGTSSQIDDVLVMGMRV